MVGCIRHKVGEKKALLRLLLTKKNVDEIVEMEVPQVSKNYRLHHRHGVTWCPVGKAANNHSVSQNGK